MMQASSTGKAALLAQQKRMDVISNNLANVNTVGFKARSATFKDTLYTAMLRPTGDQSGNLQRGTGVRLSATDLLLTSGVPEMTGVNLDFFIEGEGFFELQNGRGERIYTRNGAFGVSVEGEERFLVNAQGYYVMDKDGQKIQFPKEGDAATLTISETGELSMVDHENFATLGIATFPNAHGLKSLGDSVFGVSDASGAAQAAPEGTSVRQGYLEGSNVDTAMEMVNMMKTQRAFSLASRAITTADEMDALANNMRT